MSGVRLRGGVVIPESELEFRAARSSGPGGQSVNTTSSKVELRWSLRDSPSLSEEQRELAGQRLRSRLTADGVLILTGSEYKSQHRNRDAVVARFRAIVGEALQPPKQRRRTKPSKAARERRLQDKKQRSEVKRLRQPPDR